MKKYTIGAFQTNTYLVDYQEDGFLIDPSLDLIEVLEDIKKYNIRGILLTHGHVDHIDGIGYFDCPIYVHEKDYDALFDSSLNLYRMTNFKPSFDINKLNIIKVKDNDFIKFGTSGFKVIYTPGHTIGSCCYLYKDKLFSGDTLFKSSQGRTDFPTGSEKMMATSLVKLVTTLDQNTKVYPGHDATTTIKEEKKNNMFILRAMR